VLADENVDELEEELKALMEDTKSEGISGTLPAVPSTPLVPAREPGQGAGTLLSSLPSVPTHTFDVTGEQLEEELNRLTLKDLGALLVPSDILSASSCATDCFSRNVYVHVHISFSFRIRTEQNNLPQEDT